MTESEYLDPKRFPLTTQTNPPLKYQDQQMIDAMNMDDLTELTESGKPLNERQKGKLAELTQKAASSPVS